MGREGEGGGGKRRGKWGRAWREREGGGEEGLLLHEEWR